MSRFLSLIKDERAVAALSDLSRARRVWLDWKPFAEIKRLWPLLPREPVEIADFSRAVVSIGRNLPQEHPVRLAAETAARAVMPWKKGPFNLFGLHINAEWRSDLKWDRFADRLPDLKDQWVLDVGCNNGYYLFRCLPQQPAFLLGIDPVPRLWYQFHLLQFFANIANLEFQMWGWEDLRYLERLFDTVFCMGIIYHHFNPIQIIKHLYRVLKPGGLLVLESIVIPGDTPHCLFPGDRYARMGNVWFVPTVSAMCRFLERCKFEQVEVIAVNRHLSHEQRSTPWNPGHSFKDFLDPNDETRTIEGHPAPYRAVLFARKRT